MERERKEKWKEEKQINDGEENRRKQKEWKEKERVKWMKEGK